MKYPVPALLLIFVAVAPTPAHAQSWAVYKEDKCRLTYASSLFNRGAMNSEKFQHFSGPDKHTYFRVKGLPNEEKWSPKKIRSEYIKEKGAADVVYERTKSDFLVLSGYRGQNIFYTKIALSPDNENICVLHISYPRKVKRAFDAIVTRMSRSFTAEN